MHSSNPGQVDLTARQAFSQDLKSGRPKCAIGQHVKNKTIFFNCKWPSTGHLDAHLAKSLLPGK